jgi:hypothetical protein
MTNTLNQINILRKSWGGLHKQTDANPCHALYGIVLFDLINPKKERI